MKGQWLINNHPTNKRFNKLAKWMRSVFVGDDGSIWVPSVIAGSEGSEMVVVLCAIQDNVPVLRSQKHLYVPIDWMEKEFKSTKDTCQSIRRSISNSSWA